MWKLTHFRILMCFREVLIVTVPVDGSSNYLVPNASVSVLVESS